MNEILESIIDIDQSTQILISNTDEFLKSEEENLREEFAKLDAQYAKDMKAEAQNQYDQIYKDGVAEMERIANKSEQDLLILKVEFDKAKDKLIKQAINLITEAKQ